MGMHRKNTSKHVGDRSVAQPWFKAHLVREKKRKAMAKASKRKNRK
jgi:hypothetical protein